jgi:hypothetical protein
MWERVSPEYFTIKQKLRICWYEVHFTEKTKVQYGVMA